MQNHYQILGLNTSATAEEIRRAYRILARRYHPDVNPGRKSEETFRAIAEAYSVLSDTEKRTQYDIALEGTSPQRSQAEARAAYQKAARSHNSARKKFYEAKHQHFGQVQPEGQPTEEVAVPKAPSWGQILKDAGNFWRKVSSPPPPRPKRKATAASSRPQTSEHVEPHSERPLSEDMQQSSVVKISVVEVSINIRDAIFGVRKAIEVTEPEGVRKISVHIPPGVRTGAVLHLRSKGQSSEDLVVVVRVAAHPILNMQPKGLVAEIPISVKEAIEGANISVPTLEDPIVIKLPPGSQSGSEIRLKGRGAPLKDGSKGDLFLRLLIKVPESTAGIGLREKAEALEAYYERPVRQTLPKNLVDE
jgi:DnaJ-class molecular chaperone